MKDCEYEFDDNNKDYKHLQQEMNCITYLYNKVSYISGNLISCLCITMFMISFQKEIATWNAWQVNNTAFPISNLLTSMQNQGIGAVPPQFDNFRVDFGLDIYVDERAAPYDPNSLVNWVNRLELAEKIQINPELICNHIQLKGISWAIVPKSVIKPSCFSQSSSIDSNWILITNRIK